MDELQIIEGKRKLNFYQNISYFYDEVIIRRQR